MTIETAYFILFFSDLFITTRRKKIDTILKKKTLFFVIFKTIAQFIIVSERDSYVTLTALIEN